MKRYLYITFALLVLLAGQAGAQRRLPKMKGVSLTAGMTDGFYCKANKPDAGFSFGLAVSTYAKKRNQWVLGGEVLKRNTPYRDGSIPLVQYTSEGGYYYNFFSSSNKTVFLSIGGSAMLGYESVNGGKRLLYDGATLGQCESFIYGGAITLEAETYLSDRLVLLLRLRERILWGSASTHAHFQYGIGIKYIL